MNTILTFGGGVNSVALYILCMKKSIKIDFAIMSDTGSEKPETYQYIDYFNDFLEQKGYPKIILLPPYKDGLYAECIKYKRLPSIAYGFKSCSIKYKLDPFLKYCKNNKLFPATVLKGIDASESHRVKDYSDSQQKIIFPLVDWDIDRNDCIKIIIDAGLKLPPKSSCFFCPNMRNSEIHDLHKNNPELFNKALEMERNANLTTLKGLKRSKSFSDIVKQQIFDFDINIETHCICNT